MNAILFCLIAGVAGLLNYLSAFAQAQGLAITIIHLTQYALLTAGSAWYLVTLISASIRFLKEIASDHAPERSLKAKHD